MSKKRKLEIFLCEEKTINEGKRIRGDEKDWNQWVSATETRNYLIRDPFLDWCKINSLNLMANQRTGRSATKAISLNKHKQNFTEFIMDQGTKFETYLVAYLCRQYGADIMVDIGGSMSARSNDKVKQTLDAMNRGVPIVYSGVLHDEELRAYGVADIIIRSDWINRIVGKPVMSDEESRIAAPKLTDSYGVSPPRYHYVIIDIKFTTLDLRADGVGILNSGSFPAYKGQLYIYTHALGLMQGYEPSKAYIIGRKWKYTSRGEKFYGKNAFERFGTIDYSGVDKEYKTKTRLALEWIRDCRKNGHLWNIFQLPLPRAELYPNMSNTHDYPWHSVKEDVAEEIKEITNIWMLGVSNREKAHEQKIYKWTDPGCTPSVLGLGEGKIAQTVSKILDINRRSNGPLLLPENIENNVGGWKDKKNIEFFVDFETVNDILTDFSDIPNVETKSYIFMIGVGYREPQLGTWIYKSFMADSLSDEEEKKICTEFYNYIRREGAWYNCIDPPLYHWSFAEPNHWKEVCSRYMSIETIVLNWVDMLEIFKTEPIVIKGCIGYGLKEVAGVMKRHGMISATWDDQSSCVDGTSAMVIAYFAYQDSKLRGSRGSDMPQLKEIEKYNEVDCKVLCEIHNYIRENHVCRNTENV